MVDCRMEDGVVMERQNCTLKKMSNPSKKIRIIIADDHNVLRDSLQDLLNDQKGLEVIGSVDNGDQCIRLVRQLKPDVILMDIKMPGLSGLEATRLIKSEFPQVKIVILSTFEDEMHILEAFRAGADGYVPKTFPAAKMIESIHKLHQEGSLVPAAILSKLLQGMRMMSAGDSKGGSPDLTATELKALSLVKQGLQNKDIGRMLDISEKTVRNHLNNAFVKLGVNSRTEAIVKAMQKGLLALEE